ncbi:MAG: hypothetical protein KDD43_00440 [Bdellovibrionales bacterium]|nr:hypothetical protein [Bdellovibrionales bacterium]
MRIKATINAKCCECDKAFSFTCMTGEKLPPPYCHPRAIAEIVSAKTRVVAEFDRETDIRFDYGKEGE